MRTSALRTAALAATAATALLLTGCGSDDTGGGDEPSPTPSASNEADGGGGDAADGGGAEEGAVNGVWRTKVDGADHLLTIASQGVSLLRDKKACTGRLTEGDSPTLTLKCQGGIGEERTNGQVASAKAKSLTVKWNGGDTDTYVKVAPAPSTLPKDPEALKDLLP